MNEYNFTSGYFKALSQNLAEKSEDNLKAYRKDAVAAQREATASTAAIAAADRAAMTPTRDAEVLYKKALTGAKVREDASIEALMKNKIVRKALGLPPLDENTALEPPVKDRRMADAGTYYIPSANNEPNIVSSAPSESAIPVVAPPVAPAAITPPAAVAPPVAPPAAVAAIPAPSTSARVAPRPTVNNLPSTGPKGLEWVKKYGKTHNDDGTPKVIAKADGGFITDGGVVTNNFGLAYTDAPPKGYANGTVGGVNTIEKDPAAINSELLNSDSVAKTVPAASAAAPVPAPAAIDKLAKTNEDNADSITRNIYGATPKEFGAMMGAFGLLNFVTGKATTQDLMANAASMKKMQIEGVGVAMQEALTGNMKRALKLFSESGDDRGEGIASLEKIKINNPLAGFNKTFQNSYDGIQINYKDGSKITMDPRKFLVEAAGTAAVLKAEADLTESLQKAASSEASTAASRFATTTSAQSSANNLAYNVNRDAESNVQRKDQKFEEALTRRQNNEQRIAQTDYRTQITSLGTPGVDYIADAGKRGRVSQMLETQVNIIASTVDANILGIQDDPKFITNKRSTYNSVKRDFETMPSQPPFKIGDDFYLKSRSGNVIRLTDYQQYQKNSDQKRAEIARPVSD